MASQSDEVGQNLAITGARDEILPIIGCCCILIGKMIKYNMWNVFAERYKLEPEDKS